MLVNQSIINQNAGTAHDLPVHPITLRFNGDHHYLEEVYQGHVLTNYLSHFRLCHWIAIFFYAVYILLDAYLAPENIVYFLIIRFAIVIPLFLLGIGLSYTSWYGRIVQFMLAFYVVLTSTGFTSMVLFAPVDVHFFYALGVLACMIFGYTFIRLPLVPASAAGLISIVIYWLVQIQFHQLPQKAFVSYFSYLCGFNILLMIICYSIERSDRQNFYLSHLLVLERNKTERINESLEEVVEQRTSELQVTNERLSREIKEHISSQRAREELEKQLRHSQKMEAIGTLAGGIAHDFNNILGSVIGFTELAIDEVEPGTILGNNLEEILSAGKRARDLVKQILAFSRREEQSMQPVDLAEVLREIYNLLRATMPASIDLELNIHHQASVLADPGQIHQVFMNLGINAAQAIGSDDGKVTISLEEIVLGESFCQQHPSTEAGLYAIIVVKDTGCGIPPDVHERIFDPFFTTKPQGEGTGLGLSVVHGIIQNHGGAIAVDSMPGKGSSFKVYLPVTEKRQTTIKKPFLSPFPQGRERILLIDDEQPLLNFGQQALSKLGYRVTIQNNALEALKLFRSRYQDYDLIVADLAMPEMNGDVLTEEIRKIQPDIPVILCSGLKTAISKERIDELNIAAVIGKPVRASDLAFSIRRALGGMHCPGSQNSLMGDCFKTG